MQDLREHLPDLPQQPQQTNTTNTALVTTITTRNRNNTQTQNPNQALAGQIMPLLLQAIRPADSGQ